MKKYIIGKKVVIEELIKGNIDEVHLSTFFPKIQQECSSRKVPFYIHKNDGFFKKYSKEVDCIGFLKNSYKTFFEVEKFLDEVNKNSQKRKIIIVLDSIQDSGNFGAIIRSAKAFNANYIVFKKDNQVDINEYVIKASVGTINSSCFLKVANLNNTIEKLKKEGYWIYGTCLENASKLEEIKSIPDKVVLILGNEDKGVSQLLLKNADYKIKISTNNDIDSLNVSVSAGIILHYFYAL